MDGAMATMLRDGLTEADVCRQYAEAGADILSTNTFMPGGDPFASAGTTRMAAGEGRFVVGIIGPTYSPAMALVAARGLLAGDADALMLETICNPADARAVGEALRAEFGNVDLLCSATLTPEGTLPCGASVREFADAMLPLRPLTLGLNCGHGASHLASHIDLLTPLPCFISLHPSAGLPDDSGRYSCSPEEFAAALRPLLERRAINIVGGCCGTTPYHIKALSEIIT